MRHNSITLIEGNLLNVHTQLKELQEFSNNIKPLTIEEIRNKNPGEEITRLLPKVIDNQDFYHQTQECITNVLEDLEETLLILTHLQNEIDILINEQNEVEELE